MGVHLIECQPDQKAHQISSWPGIVLLLATRCSMGGTSDWISAWLKGLPNVKLTWCSTALGHYMPLQGVGGGMSDWRSAWPKGSPNVKLTWCSVAVGHQMSLPGGYIWLKCKKDIWKFEHAFISCFASQRCFFFTKDQWKQTVQHVFCHYHFGDGMYLLVYCTSHLCCYH